MKKVVWCLVILAALLAVTLAAQEAKPAPFSELEQAKLQAIAQEGRALEAEQRVLDLQRAGWQAKVAAFKAAAEAARPGFTWDAETGKWAALKPPVGGSQ